MNYFKTRWALTTVLFLVYFVLFAQNEKKNWGDIIRKSDAAWFASPEAIAIAENVLLYQRNIGGWPKNIQMQNPLTELDKTKLIALKNNSNDVTTDNGATCQEMLFLSKVNRQTPNLRYEKAFLLGLHYLLEAQYENGGWPQFYPLKNGYYTHITYNDNLMVNILTLLKQIIDKPDYYTVSIPKETLKKVETAFDKGIKCILKTQYKQKEILTVWCAQYDEDTLLPAKARAYELPSLSGKESAKIVLLLMTIENPSTTIIKAVESACAWFDQTKITTLKEVRTYTDAGKIKEKTMMPTVMGLPLWARFMELDDNSPFFCDRDGIKKKSLQEIGQERRIGYAWYTDEPEEVLKRYLVWKKKYTSDVTVKKKIETQNIITVAQDGSGDFKEIQAAINATKAFPYDRITILIKNGIYSEKVKIPEFNDRISLIGESKEKTIISYNDNFDKINLGRNSTFYTYTLLVEANDFFVSNLTIKNASGDVGQAIALSVIGDRTYVLNCNIIGNQDTLYASGNNAKHYFRDCYIEGTTDFIFGKATVLFENCEIHSLKNSYITAASTSEGSQYGFVFKNCNLTASETTSKVFLGRPWRIYAKTVFINCKMGSHILPQGWENWSKTEAEKTSFYAEYNCIGPGFKPEKRVPWSHQLTQFEADKYSNQSILGSINQSDQWYLTVGK